MKAISNKKYWYFSGLCLLEILLVIQRYDNLSPNKLYKIKSDWHLRHFLNSLSYVSVKKCVINMNDGNIVSKQNDHLVGYK